MARLRSALWGRSSPRIGFSAEREKSRGASVRGELPLESDVANQMAGVYDRYISDAHPPNPLTGNECRVGFNLPCIPEFSKDRDPRAEDWGGGGSSLQSGPASWGRRG